MATEIRKSKYKSHLQARPDKQFLIISVSLILAIVGLSIIVLSN